MREKWSKRTAPRTAARRWAARVSVVGGMLFMRSSTAFRPLHRSPRDRRPHPRGSSGGPRLPLSLALAGLLGTILNTSSALSQPLFGLAADRLSRSHLVALGPVLTVIAMSLTGVLPTYPALIAALLCAGIGTAIFHPQGAATAGFHGGDRRAAGLAIFVTGGELPYALGPLYIPALGQGGGA